MSGKRLTLEEKSQIINLYQQGYNTVQLGEMFNKDNTTILDILKKNNIPIHHKKKLFLQNDIDNIIDLYNNQKVSTINIGKIYNVSDRTIAQILKDNDIELRKSGIQSKIQNEDYFKVIDTQNKAYYLGLLIADGSIIPQSNRTNRNHALSLSLEETDKYLLELFAKELGCDNKYLSKRLREKGNYQYDFRSSNKQIVEDLSKYGVIPRKTGLEYLPSNVPENLKRHLIRGIFDGDGTVYISKEKLHFGFYGSNTICNNIKEYLIDSIKISNNKVFDKGTVSFIYFSKQEDIFNFYNFIYKDADIYMRRKKEKFDLILN